VTYFVVAGWLNDRETWVAFIFNRISGEVIMNQDIRWIQRLDSWTRAMEQMKRFMSLNELDEFQEQGLIQCFEYNHELAWKTQKDFLEAQGVQELYGSKNVVQQAFAIGLIADGEVWMDMIKSRNLSVHTYNEETKQQVVSAITDNYYDTFLALHAKLTDLANK
jgi:nucleotidyltransferase substrate binding protein (TIGR01987 family)